MKFPVAIEMGNGFHAYGAAIPDLPGCFCAGDSLDEALSNARDAIELHCEQLALRGGLPPKPRPLEGWRYHPHFAGWMWSAVEAPVERFF
jgi:predicted RNase H-like HicB family nuclease